MSCFIWNIDYSSVSQKLNLRSCGRKSSSNWPSCWGGFELTSRKTQSQLRASHNSLRFLSPSQPIVSSLLSVTEHSKTHPLFPQLFTHIYFVFKTLYSWKKKFSSSEPIYSTKKGKRKKNARTAAWLAQLGVHRSAGSPRVRTRPDQHSANG